jgi:anaerobic magnesium-protoporphyrin IX monomethyl ester cyclase
VNIDKEIELKRERIRSLRIDILKKRLSEVGGSSDRISFDFYGRKYFCPYGLLSLGSFLNARGYVSSIVILNDLLPNEKSAITQRIQEEIEQCDNDNIVVGITCTTGSYNNAIECLEIAKEIDSEITTVIGGPHVTFELPEKNHTGVIDVIIRGEGEVAFYELLHSLKRGSICQDAETRVIDGKWNNEIDTVPMFSLIPKSIVDQFVLYVLSSRGCPHNCAFCVEQRIFGNRLRYMSTPVFLKMIEILRSNYNRLGLHIADSDFCANKNHAREVCNGLLENKLDVSLSVNTNPQFWRFWRKDSIGRMIAAGIHHFEIGVETSNDGALKLANKGAKFVDSIKTLRLLRKSDAKILTAYWMIGLPGETESTILDSINQLEILFDERLIDTVEPKYFIPYPGTEYYSHPEKFGLEILSRNWMFYDRYSRILPYKLKNVKRHTLRNLLLLSLDVAIEGMRSN